MLTFCVICRNRKCSLATGLRHRFASPSQMCSVGFSDANHERNESERDANRVIFCTILSTDAIEFVHIDWVRKSETISRAKTLSGDTKTNIDESSNTLSRAFNLRSNLCFSTIDIDFFVRRQKIFQ